LSTCNYPEYNKQVRTFVKELIGDFLPQPPVYTDNALVEANLLKDKNTQQYYVSLVNYSGKPLKNLKVMINAELLNVNSAESAYQRANIEKKGNFLTLTIDINDFDFLILH